VFPDAKFDVAINGIREDPGRHGLGQHLSPDRLFDAVRRHEAKRLGRENGREAIHEYTEVKSVWIDSGPGMRDPFNPRA
jgi:hypothetical protein